MINFTRGKHFHSVFFITCSFFTYIQSDVPRPRGVSLSKAPLYSPTKDFTCFDGTITIPFSYVNDDYCDCFDGSDEPGTSACLNGVFHCSNAGHRPLNIPSSRVNDGVCDCCDGTDEYTSPDTCRNTCEELGKEARAEAQRVAELYKAGNQLRLELIEKGILKRNEMGEQLAQLEMDRAEAEKIKAEKEALKSELEAKENDALKVYREAEEQEKQKKAEQERENVIKESMDYFQKFDSNNDGVLTADEIKVIDAFDKNKDGVVDEEEFKYFLGESDSVDKDSFTSTTWAMVKPLLMMEKGMFKPAEVDEEHERATDGEENGSDLETEYGGNDEDGANDEDDADDADSPNNFEEQELQEKNDYDEETQKLVDDATEARRQLTDAERAVREIEANIKKIQTDLEKDYGLHQEYAALDGQCWEYEDKEYVYRFCMFDKVTQKSKNGGMEIGLGGWGEWAGSDLNKYSAMKYTNGLACWNGPSRMTTVNLNCGLETKLLSVTEPFRCEYKMEFITPAACDDSNAAQQHSSHDEL